eukprot:scaffold346_cov116-Cylindrotheca_fusiformis.AAC.12
MIEVVLNDRLGKKVRVKCNEDDTIGDLKKLAAAQLGTSALKKNNANPHSAEFSARRPEKLKIQKWYTIYKDHITLEDYEIHDGMGLELHPQRLMWLWFGYTVSSGALLLSLVGPCFTLYRRDRHTERSSKLLKSLKLTSHIVSPWIKVGLAGALRDGFCIVFCFRNHFQVFKLKPPRSQGTGVLENTLIPRGEIKCKAAQRTKKATTATNAMHLKFKQV